MKDNDFGPDKKDKLQLIFIRNISKTQRYKKIGSIYANTKPENTGKTIFTSEKYTLKCILKCNTLSDFKSKRTTRNSSFFA